MECLVAPVDIFVCVFPGMAQLSLSGENGAALIQGWDFDKRVPWG